MELKGLKCQGKTQGLPGSLVNPCEWEEGVINLSAELNREKGYLIKADKGEVCWIQGTTRGTDKGLG